MHNPETTDEGKAILAGLDFDDYGDQMARTIRDWHAASERWNEQIRHSRYIPAGRGRARANNKIIRSRRQCVRAFEAAARLIVADSPIEERAVRALDGAIREEDDHRLDIIDSWYKTLRLTPVSDAYVRDVSLSFADPAGHTLMLDSDELILSHEAALELYEARLKENELSIFHQPLVETAENPVETAARYGARALGAAWIAARGLKNRRKRA